MKNWPLLLPILLVARGSDSTGSGPSASPSQPLVTVGRASMPPGGGNTATLQTRAADGTSVSQGGQAVAFTASGGTSRATFGPVAEHGDGSYSTPFNGVLGHRDEHRRHHQ
jgi:hypothetical protein